MQENTDQNNSEYGPFYAMDIIDKIPFASRKTCFGNSNAFRINPLEFHFKIIVFACVKIIIKVSIYVFLFILSLMLTILQLKISVPQKYTKKE